MNERFVSARSDGRSDGQVIYDLAAGHPPGTLFGYGELIDALAVGLDERPPRDRVYRAVAAGNRVLLREQRRYLSVVKNCGYRMLAANEHLPAALIRKDRAQGYLQRGIALLRDARLEELTSAQRTLHEGQLMVLSGIYSAVADSHRRHDRADALIADLIKRDRAIEERLDYLERRSEDE